MEKSCGKSVCRKIVAGKSLQDIFAGKLFWENLAGKSCGKILCEILQENLAGKSCGKFLKENLVRKILAGKSCGKLL